MNRKTNMVVFLLLVLMVALIALYTGGCAAEEEKNVLRVGVLSEIESLNPFMVWSMQGYEVMQLNYSLLTSWDENLDPIANLAEEWSSSEDGLEWVFKLRQGVTWHDGEPFTAEDVKFTLELNRDLGDSSFFYDYVSSITGVELLDDHTVRIETDQPLSWMPQMWLPILPKHIWEDIDPEYAVSEYTNPDPVGTGPFHVVEHVQGQHTRLVRNEQYFKGAPQLDEVILITYANADIMVEALKRGDIDIVTSVPGAQFKALEEAAPPDVHTLAASSPSFSQLAINVWKDPESKGNPLLLDRNIRLAMEYAIDRPHLIEVAFFGYGEPGSTLIPPMYDFWHLKLDPAEERNYDPARAREILDEAGYRESADGIRVSPEGEPLSFRLFVRNESPMGLKAAQLIKDWFKDISIEIEVISFNEGTFVDNIFDSDFDLFIWGWYVDVDLTSMLKVMTTDEIMSWNNCFYSNPAYDALHAEQQRQLDWRERQKTILEMQRIIHEDNPYIILSYDLELQAYRTDRFEGWVPNPANGPVIYTNTVFSYEQLQPVK